MSFLVDVNSDGIPMTLTWQDSQGNPCAQGSVGCSQKQNADLIRLGNYLLTAAVGNPLFVTVSLVEVQNSQIINRLSETQYWRFGS